MIDNDQSAIIEAPEVYKSIPTHSPTAKPTTTTECTWEKNVNFDTFDGHVMVNFIEPNFQDIIIEPIRVGLITQKQFWAFFGPDPLLLIAVLHQNSRVDMDAQQWPMDAIEVIWGCWTSVPLQRQVGLL
jgi:hypothetical protein